MINLRLQCCVLNSHKCRTPILSKKFHGLKAVATVTSEHLSLLTIFVVSHFLSAKVSPKWRLSPGFRTHKNCPFPLNRGVPSIEATNTKINVNVFPGPNFVSQRRSSTVSFYFTSDESAKEKCLQSGFTVCKKRENM